MAYALRSLFTQLAIGDGALRFTLSLFSTILL